MAGGSRGLRGLEVITYLFRVLFSFGFGFGWFFFFFFFLLAGGGGLWEMENGKMGKWEMCNGSTRSEGEGRS